MKRLLFYSFIYLLSFVFASTLKAITLDECVVLGPQWESSLNDIKNVMAASTDFVPVEMVFDCDESGQQNDSQQICDDDVPSPFISSDTIYKTKNSKPQAYVAFDFNRGDKLSQMTVAFPITAFGQECDLAEQEKLVRRWLFSVLLEAVPSLNNWKETDFSFSVKTDNYDLAILYVLDICAENERPGNMIVEEPGYLVMLYGPPQSVYDKEETM